METNDIVKLILSDNKQLEKSTRYHNLPLEKKVDLIISQRPELKNCLTAPVGGNEVALKLKQFAEQQQDIPDDIQAIINDNFWDLL